MDEQKRSVPEAERVKDLEVTDDEARDIAGGKKPNPFRSGKKAAGFRAGSEPPNERKQT